MKERDEAKRTVKMLYLLECRDSYCWRLFPLYAIDEEEAQSVANHILRDYPHLTQEKLVQQPQGFVLVRYRLPGRILWETSNELGIDTIPERATSGK